MEHENHPATNRASAAPGRDGSSRASSLVRPVPQPSETAGPELDYSWTPTKRRIRMTLRTVAAPMLLAFALGAISQALAADAPKEDGKALYAKKCAMCHGADGVAKPFAKGAA